MVLLIVLDNVDNVDIVETYENVAVGGFYQPSIYFLKKLTTPYQSIATLLFENRTEKKLASTFKRLSPKESARLTPNF
jgi:hypothetical protein